MWSCSSCTAWRLSKLVGKYSSVINLSIVKNIRYDEKKHNRTRSSVFMRTKTPCVIIQWGIEMTSFGRFFFFISVPISVWYWHGKHTSNVCSKQCVKTQMTCKQSGFSPIDQLLDQLKRKVRTQPLELNLNLNPPKPSILRYIRKATVMSATPTSVWVNQVRTRVNATRHTYH